MLRYLRLLNVQFRASALLAMQYRVEFVGELLLAFFWVGWSLVPLLVVFDHRSGVAGWSYEEALVVLGWFSLVKGILEGQGGRIEAEARAGKGSTFRVVLPLASRADSPA